MRRNVTKRLLASVLAGTMVLGMSVTAFADDTTGSTTGTGEFEGHVDKNALSVQLPTVPAENPFSYTMDPEGLIAATEGAKNTAATFENDANVYFLSAPNTYTKVSKKLKVVNKGTVDADVTIAAETVANSDVKMVAADGFTAEDSISDTNKGAELYLGLIVANKTAVPVYANGQADVTAASVTVGLKGNDANYEVKYTPGADGAPGTYSYAEKENVPATAWNSFEFGLTGACNANGNYSATGLGGSNVNVTWSYAERAKDSSADLLAPNATDAAGPSLVGSSFTMTAGQPFEVQVNLGSGNLKATGIASISFERDGSDVAIGSTRYTFADDTITFESSWVDSQLAGITTSRTYKIVFNDTANTEKTFTVTK